MLTLTTHRSTIWFRKVPDEIRSSKGDIIITKLDVLQNPGELLQRQIDLLVLKVDVTNQVDNDHVLEKNKRRFGGLDAVLNNAG